jgi:hypothetical protein
MSNPGTGPQPSTFVQAPVCPAQITEEAILAFPDGKLLPAINEANASPAVAESYAKLVEHYSASMHSAQTVMRGMNRAWHRACILAQKYPLVQPTSSLSNSVPESSSSAVTPAGSAMKASSALARDPALFHKLAEASISSLNRKDKKIMGEVFSRHAKPLGLSAKALASALHAIDHSKFPAQVSDADAECKLKEVDASNKGYANFEEFCRAAKISSNAGAETHTSAARDVFLRFVKGLSAQELVAALEEVDAPVLLSSEGSSPEQIFRRADINMNGWVDFAELDPPPKFPSFFAVMLVTLASGSCVQLSCPTIWK